MNLSQLQTMLRGAAVVVIDGTSYRIDHCDDHQMACTCQETGQQVDLEYTRIDPARDQIYQLTLMNPV